jgi:hypothetical protein
MPKFTAKYAAEIQGVLSGFDRLVIRGSLRQIAYPRGMQGFLFMNKILMKEFGGYVNDVSKRVKQAALSCMVEADRPVEYLASSRVNKEELARAIAAKHKIQQGPVCALTCVEPCFGFDIQRNPQTKTLDLVQRPRKCLYVYQYWLDPALGWMNARIATWFPLSVQICLNGREWLAQQMDQAGIMYERQDNCFPWVSDWARAQELMDEQRKADWPALLNQIASRLNPLHTEIFRHFPVDYYWSAYQSEWATDVCFRQPEDLRRLYPLFVHHAMTTFRSPDILRFLGKKLTKSGEINGHVDAEITSDLKRRQEGVRIKHRYNQNSEKLYDKAYTSAGAVLRAEMTMADPEDFLAYRQVEGAPEGSMEWLRMRKGIADLYHRGEVSQQINLRYLDALAAVDDSTSLLELIGPLERPVVCDGKRSRALRPFDVEDRRLLQAISGGEFLIRGFRNKDLQSLLYDGDPESPKEARRRSGAVGRKLRLLRNHGLIRKIPKSHRYKVTAAGQQILIALFTASRSTVQTLLPKAA